MKKLFIPLLLSTALAQAAGEKPFQRYQCDDGQSFEIRLDAAKTSLELRQAWAIKTLPQVSAASGTKYSDAQYTVWLKGNDGFLEYQQEIIAKNCSAIPLEEPLTPIRDAASGLIFVAPDRWTAKKVSLDVKSGSDIPQYGDSATQQFKYRFHADGQSESYPLLDILVFPKTVWDKLSTTESIGQVLGDDSQRVYVAQLPIKKADYSKSRLDTEYNALQTNLAEVQQGFSMYGIVKQQAVESVTTKVMWLDRRLYPGAVLTVELRDVSLMDAPAEVIAKQVITLEQGAPPTVTLKFSPDAINPKHTYSMGVRLEMDGKLIKINDTHTPVLTRGAGREVTVMLKNI